ncbi:MAG: hypothetical protein ACRD4D_08700 [Candidatus Acidiferrales bacterium]
MTLTTKARTALVLGLVLTLGLPALAQTVAPAIQLKAPKPKKEKFKGEVLYATRAAITVRSRDNSNLVRTFTYDTKLSKKINEQFDKNKLYQHGDRVVITFVAGGDLALKIKGKPGQKRY